MKAELHLKAALKLSEDGDTLLQMASLQERLGRAQLADSYLRRCLRHAAVERSVSVAETEVIAEAGTKERAELGGALAAAAKKEKKRGGADMAVERDDFAAEAAAAAKRENEVLAAAKAARDAARSAAKAATAEARERDAFVEATCATRRAVLLEEIQPALKGEADGWRKEAVRLYEHALGVAPDFKAAATRLRALAAEDAEEAKLAALAKRADTATSPTATHQLNVNVVAP